MMEYKGYHADVVFDEDTNYWCGSLYGIRDLVMFGGETWEELEKDFHDAVEDYLEVCRADGQEPNRESDTESNENTNLEIKSDLYDSLLTAAKKIGKTPTELVEKILTDYLAKTA